MKNLFLAATTLLLVTNGQAREPWGPPSACPQPKVDCCPKPKCPKPCPPKPCPKPCPPKPCKPVCKPVCKPCKPECPPPCCDPCCPPVCFERGYPTSDCCTPSAYVEPANIDLRCGWDVFFTASFIYWEAMQDGMDLALPGQATAINPVAGVTMPATGHHVLYQDFEFKPGFQVGLGWSGGRDGWTLYGEYTWVRGTTHTSADAPAPGVAQINNVNVGSFGVWIPTSWFPSYLTTNPNHATTSISSKWEYALDIADLQLSRPSYIGTHFVLEPLFGLRGLWIRQDLDLTAAVLNATQVTLPGAFRTAHYKSHSWAVGPRAGFNGKWHFCYGFRLIGDATASLLYTRYTEVTQDVGTPNATQLPLRLELDDYDALRPNLDLSLGFGWGSYFWCRRFHWDVAATYDFSVFWQQNMMRYLADLTASFDAHPDGAPSNLYLQGLTIKTEFEF